ncbi:alanine aminotransferase 2-like [Polymixia lowei]
MTSLQQMNPRVRGIRASPYDTLQSLAAHITDQISQAAQKAFKDVVDVSSGDPHKAGVKPISFVRQVLAVCLYPELLHDENLPLDVKLRAQKLLEACDGGSVGSYSASSGLLQVQHSVAEFISRRDAGVPSFFQNIFISSGSQRALMVIMKLLVSGEGKTQTGVLTPLPCPRTVPMLLDEAGARLVPYQLREDRGWAVDLEELQLAVETARRSCHPRALYISNPGNPTGHLQDRNSIEEVIKFAAAEGLFLLVNEVYQDSVYGQSSEFCSYKKVLFEMARKFSETVELASFHSLSNGIMGECGLRAGYMELVNMDPAVMRFAETMLCTDISTPVIGQLALELMVSPPKPGDASYDTYTQEVLYRQVTLAQNAQRAWEFLNGLPGMSCQPAMGGIYVYPRLNIPPGMVTQAKIFRMEADVLYCQMLLEEEGVCVGAGCENGQEDGNYHLRLCVLVPPATLEEVLAHLSSFHLGLLDRYSHPDRGVKDIDLGETSTRF